MGHRTLKRVPLDFQWPNEVWKGYINPYPGPTECSACNGTGYNPETKRIADAFYDFEGTGERWCDAITQDEVWALIQEGRLREFTHKLTRDGKWKPRVWWIDGFFGPHRVKRFLLRCVQSIIFTLYPNAKSKYLPSAEEVNAWEQGRGIGHDAVNRWILIEARAKRLGVYGRCQICGGEGEIPNPDPEIRKTYEEWQEYEPPTGEGWQLWETVTEGSPVSPVFASAEELAEWCEENATIFASEKTSKENWLKRFLGQKDLDVGSMLVMGHDYFGALANEPERREFHLGDILSITTGKLVSIHHVDGIYDILNFMTGDSLFTHQLPRAGEERRPTLLRQHPQLKEVDASSPDNWHTWFDELVFDFIEFPYASTKKWNEKRWRLWLKRQIAKFGEFLPISPLPAGMHQVRDPIEEMREMAPNAKIIPIIHD